MKKMIVITLFILNLGFICFTSYAVMKKKKLKNLEDTLRKLVEKYMLKEQNQELFEKTVYKFFEKGGKIDQIMYTDKTNLLGMAVLKNNAAMVKILLDIKPLIVKKQEEKVSLLSGEERDLFIVQQVLQDPYKNKEKFVSHANILGMTPLMMLVEKKPTLFALKSQKRMDSASRLKIKEKQPYLDKKEKILQLLVDNGGGLSIGKKDKFGKTALHYASKNGFSGIFEVLLGLLGENKKKLLRIKDKSGKTALNYAQTGLKRKDYLAGDYEYIVEIIKAELQRDKKTGKKRGKKKK